MKHSLERPKEFSLPIRPARNRSRVRPLVLVVEDHEDTRLLYRYVLEMLGYEVIEATKGADAIRLAKEQLPDLVLIDTNLPEVDGLSATRSMRQEVTLIGLPIIFISGHAQPEFRAAALAAGGNDYLVKPMSISDLEASVRRHLARGRTWSSSLSGETQRHPSL